jgi:hypothetical protein
MPIPACDAQFNGLLEQRDRILHDLRCLDELVQTGLTRDDDVGRITKMLAASPAISTELAERLRGVVRDASGAKASSR